MSRIFGWLGRGIVVCAGCSPPRRGTSPSPRVVFDRATFFPWTTRCQFDRQARVSDVASPCRYDLRTNRLCRLAPAHQGMNSRSCGLVQRIGTADSATPYPDPSGGQAPALHFSVDYEKPIDDSVRVAEVASPCWCYFRTNRPCRLGPAHQGMKIGAAHTPLDSGTVSGFGVCFRRKDEVGSPCGRRWWYRG